jgi:hypothetical protein
VLVDIIGDIGVSPYLAISLHHGGSRTSWIIQDIHPLKEFEHHTLDGGGGGDHDSASADRAQEFLMDGGVGLRRAVEIQSENSFVHDGRKGGPHDCTAELKEGRRNHLNNQILAISHH